MKEGRNQKKKNKENYKTVLIIAGMQVLKMS